MREVVLKNCPTLLAGDTGNYRAEKTIFDPELGLLVLHDFRTLESSAMSNVDQKFLEDFCFDAWHETRLLLTGDNNLISLEPEDLGKVIVPVHHIGIGFPKDFKGNRFFLLEYNKDKIRENLRKEHHRWASLSPKERSALLKRSARMLTGAFRLEKLLGVSIPFDLQQAATSLDAFRMLLYRMMPGIRVSSKVAYAFSIMWTFFFHYLHPEKRIRVIFFYNGKETKDDFILKLNSLAFVFRREPNITKFDFWTSPPRFYVEEEFREADALVLVGADFSNFEQRSKFFEVAKKITEKNEEFQVVFS